MPLSIRALARRYTRFRANPKLLLGTWWSVVEWGPQTNRTTGLVQVIGVTRKTVRCMALFTGTAYSPTIDVPVALITHPMSRFVYIGYAKEFAWLRIGLGVMARPHWDTERTSPELYVTVTGFTTTAVCGRMYRHALLSQNAEITAEAARILERVPEPEAAVTWAEVNDRWRPATAEEAEQARAQDQARRVALVARASEPTLEEELRAELARRRAVQALTEGDSPEPAPPEPTPVEPGPSVWEHLEDETP